MRFAHQCSRCGTTVSKQVLGGLCHRCVGRRLVVCTPSLAGVDGAVRRRLGRYVLKRRLGEGGFGVVYAAVQQAQPRRSVALKIIKPVVDRVSMMDRFESERRALGLMDHPNIAKSFSAGSTINGQPFLVMELVRGIGIKDYCKQNQLKLEARLRLFLVVCQAVHHAHEKRIIHGDIKPSNILVTNCNGKPHIKLIDFGIARDIGEPAKRSGSFIGTPGYMSPEQSSGCKQKIDQRSDIYSLGILLRELLACRTATNGGPASLTERLPILVAGLRRVLTKCLQNNPDRRYESVNGLIKDICLVTHCRADTSRPLSARKTL